MTQNDKITEDLLAQIIFLKQKIMQLEKLVGESKQTLEILQSSEVYCRKFFEQANDAIFIADPQTRKLLDCNLRAEELIGRSKTEILSMHADDLHPKDLVDETMELFRRQATGEDIVGESFILAKDGIRIPVSINTTFIELDGKPTVVGIFRDITERNKVAETLRENERRLKEAQEMACLGFWHWNVKTGNVEWSEQVYKIFCLDPKEFIPHIDSILALSPWPQDHERNKELIRKAKESHESGSYEQRFLRPDKSIGYYYSTFQGKYDDLGNIIAIVGTVQDITERKQAEEVLLIQRKFNDAVLENMDAGVVACNEKGELVLFNQAARDWHGLDALKIPQPQWASYYNLYMEDGVTPMDINTIPLARAFRGEEVHDVGMVIAAKGRSKRQLVVHAGTIKGQNGQILGAVTVMHDISERKLIEVEIKENENFLNAIIDNIPNMIFVKDAQELKFLRLNKVGEQLFGYTKEELYGKNDFDFFPKTEAEFFTEKDRVVLKTKQGVDIPEEFFTKRTGEKIILHTKKMPILDNQGNPLYLLGISEDITERKKIEVALQESDKRFMDVLNASRDAILLIDANIFVDCNEATVKMLGYSTRKEFLMVHPSNLSPDIQPDGQRSFDKAEEMIKIALEKGYNRFEWMHRKASGVDFLVEVSLTSIPLYGKNIIHCVWRDLTQINELIEVERKHTKELEVFYKLAVGREDRIIELKKEVQSLKEELDNRE